MKKLGVGIFILFSFFLLTACGNNHVTQEELKENNWTVETDEKDVPNFIVSFTDHVMSFKPDTDSVESTAKDEWEKLGEDLAKQLMEQMNYKLEYELDKDEMKIQNAENEKEFIYYTVTRDDKNIVLTPDKEKNKNNPDAEKLVLQPYKKSKTQASSSTEETTASSEKETANIDDVIKNFEDKSLVVYKPRKMTQEDFGMAPMSAIDAKIFSLIETDNEDEQKNARVFTFDNLEDLQATKKYYDDLGKNSAMLFSYTAADEDNLVLMQFNGELPQKLVEEYTDVASLKLTEPPFEMNSSQETAVSFSEVNNQEQNEPVSTESSQAVAVPASSSEQVQTQPSSSEEPQGEEYTTLQEGEGPNQVAARVGISVDQLFELNGMDPNNYMLYPGQQLRVK